MKLIGIVERAYYNRDNQKIMQVNEAVRKALSAYEDIALVGIMPTNPQNYVDIKMGQDKLGEEDIKKLDYLLEKCDGFLIPGGTYWYQFDEYVIKHAISHKKPLLAICAGFQAICSLYAVDRDKFNMTKKLAHDLHYGEPEDYIHPIRIFEHTKLHQILGENQIMVNSVHQDYIDFKMKELTISALSEDGIIEAIELPNHPFFVGVEWHPEYLMDTPSHKIFDEFINSVKKLQSE